MISFYVIQNHPIGHTTGVYIYTHVDWFRIISLAVKQVVNGLFLAWDQRIWSEGEESSYFIESSNRYLC